ncbi:MAG: endo-1,4-beta-xylanase, partial [Candidatus Solibacter usitatus]|nr:endo-1,4-beta-xylanase [Candidatus Solibacter usitatus]
NVMKFGPIHPARNAYNFAPADALLAFAAANKMTVRGHTLVWHNQNPAWLTNGNFTPPQLAEILQEHITTVVKRYAGRVAAWDVVNEAFNDNGTIRATIWSNSPGLIYVEQAFRWAREADPAAGLFYNDYSAELINAKSDAIYAMARDFVARGVPLTGIGWQMHLTTNTGSLASMESNLKRLTDLGLQVQITELDVRLPIDSSGAAAASALETQARIYRDVITLCLKFPLCTMVQTWGFTDKYSWIPGTFPGTGAALLFDASYRPKSAHAAFLDAMKNAPPALSAAGLRNAASLTPGDVAPGEIVELIGANYGAAAQTNSELDADGKVPSQWAATRLLFDGVPAPILETRVQRTKAVVPFALAGKTSTRMEYEYRGIRSTPVTIGVTAAAPGLYTVTAENPARRGEDVLLFATGVGELTPPVPDGTIVAEEAPPTLVLPARVTIGGVDCPIVSAAAVPGQVAGYVGIRVTIPQDVPSGAQPVVLRIGDVATTNDVTILVQ